METPSEIFCAAAHAMRGLGKEVRLYLHEDSPLPAEYHFLDLTGLERRLDPASLAGWTLLALDCGNERRLGPVRARSCWAPSTPSSTSTITTTTPGSGVPT